MSNNANNNPGEILRTTREKQGLSINDVSVATKINPRIIKALEEGNREGLPPVSFTRGFIRSYAAYLKIDAQPILDAYFADDSQSKASAEVTPESVPTSSPTPTTQTPTPKDEPLAAKYSSTEEKSVTQRVFIGGGLLVAVLLVIGIKSVYEKYAKERVIEPVTVSNEDPVSPLTDGSEGLVAPTSDTTAGLATPGETTTAQVATPSPTPSPQSTPAVTAAPAISPTATATPTPAPTATPKPTATPTPTPTATPKPSPTVTPAATPASASTTNPQEVILEALDNVEVTIAVDGGSSQKIELKPESLHTIKAKQSVVLDIKDGGMVNIIHNGRDKGVPGALGKPVKVKFP